MWAASVSYGADGEAASLTLLEKLADAPEEHEEWSDDEWSAWEAAQWAGWDAAAWEAEHGCYPWQFDEESDADEFAAAAAAKATPRPAGGRVNKHTRFFEHGYVEHSWAAGEIAVFNAQGDDLLSAPAPLPARAEVEAFGVLGVLSATKGAKPAAERTPAAAAGVASLDLALGSATPRVESMVRGLTLASSAKGRASSKKGATNAFDGAEEDFDVIDAAELDGYDDEEEEEDAFADGVDWEDGVALPVRALFGTPAQPIATAPAQMRGTFTIDLPAYYETEAALMRSGSKAAAAATPKSGAGKKGGARDSIGSVSAHPDYQALLKVATPVAASGGKAAAGAAAVAGIVAGTFTPLARHESLSNDAEARRLLGIFTPAEEQDESTTAAGGARPRRRRRARRRAPPRAAPPRRARPAPSSARSSLAAAAAAAASRALTSRRSSSRPTLPTRRPTRPRRRPTAAWCRSCSPRAVRT